MKPILRILLGICLIITGACGELSPRTQGPLPALTKAPRPAYTGPVQVSFDTSLVSPVLASYGYHKSQPAQTLVFPAATDFKIQALPEGPVVFQETFTQGTEPLELSRSFQVTDTSKVYTLHLQNGDATGQHPVAEATVKLNGHRWIGPSDFAAEPLELEKTDILLEANTSLSLQLAGEPEAQLTLTVVEAGAAGTIRRLNAHNTAPAAGQATFDPDDPDSLGALEPFVQIPVSEDGRSLPTFSLNGGVPATISGGELLLKIRPPVQQNLAQILQRYQGRVMDEISSDEFQIFVNLDTVILKALPANLRALNALVDGDAAIESVAFDSGQGARMFALMVELLLAAQQDELIEALDVNPVLFNNAAGSFEGRSTQGNQSMNAQDSWWLKQTGVLQAWDRSMGFQRANNRPVRVAVVDSDFVVLDEGIKTGQDLQGQVLTTRLAEVTFNAIPQHGGQGTINRVLSEGGQQAFVKYDQFLAQKTGHGTSQASTIASNINDEAGIVGVAPHAKIIPVKIGSFKPKREDLQKANLGSNVSDVIMGWELRMALQAAGLMQADIVSVTSSTVSNDIDNWLNNVNAMTTGAPYGWLNALQYQVDLQAQVNRMICLFNAGNMGSHVRNTLPAGKLRNIVIVGAVAENLSRTPPFERALFLGAGTENGLFNPIIAAGNTTSKLHQNEEAASVWWTGGSSPNNPNVSSQIMHWETTLGAQNLKIWAPGRNMGAFGAREDLKDIHNSALGRIAVPIVSNNWGGTSAATPFTAGALALLKALQPDLTVPDLISGNWVKFKTVQSTDNLLKDFYAQGVKRHGVRLPPFNLSVPVIDVAATLAGNAQLNTPANQLKEFVGTLRQGADNRPYLETDNGNWDLAQFVEVEAFHTSSSSSQDARLKELSGQLKQNNYQVFWNKVAFNIGSQKVRNSGLINSLVRVKGWSYQVLADNAYPQKIEVADVIYQTTDNAMKILSAPDSQSLPVNSYVYDKTGNRWLIPGQTLDVNPNDFVGINFSQPIHNLEVKIGPILVPIIDILENLAVIGIPDDLPSGVHDVVLKASGQTLTLEQVVSKASGVIQPYPEPPHTPPSNNPGQRKAIRIFNVSGNDQARAYLNGSLLATVEAEEDLTIELGPDSAYPLLTSQRNEIRMELTSQGPGYTYGFEVFRDSDLLFRDIQGNAANQQLVLTPEGEIDPRTDLVYTERLWLHNTGILPIGAGDFWVKIYNMGHDEELKISANNQTGDIQWPNDQFLVKPQYQTFYRQLPWHSEICVQGTDCWCRQDLNDFCWSRNTLNLEFFNTTGSYSYAFEVYKGIYLIYRNRDGQPNGWGAENNRQEISNPWGIMYAQINFWKYGMYYP